MGPHRRPHLFLNNVTIDVPYPSGKVPYNFNFYRFTTRIREFVYFYRNSGREGEVVLDGKHYRVLVLDDNADGRFDDLAKRQPCSSISTRTAFWKSRWIRPSSSG